MEEIERKIKSLDKINSYIGPLLGMMVASFIGSGIGVIAYVIIKKDILYPLLCFFMLSILMAGIFAFVLTVIEKEILFQKNEKEKIIREERVNKLSYDEYKEIHIEKTENECTDNILSNTIIKAKLVDENTVSIILCSNTSGKEDVVNTVCISKEILKKNLVQVFENNS